MIRLIATDVDGTLTVPGGPVPAENRDALREAHARGVRVALATVRVHWTAKRIVDALGIPCGLVSLGGATVFDEEGALVRRLVIGVDLAMEMAEFADRHGFGLLVTVDGAHRYGPGFRHMLPGVVEDQRFERDNLSCVTGAPERLMMNGDRAVGLLMEAFADAPLRFVRHYRADGSLIDAAVTAREATKESGLAALAERMGVAAADVLALGDAESDAGMLRWAGVGVAVGAAVAGAQAAADWISPAAAAGGLAAAVRRFANGETAKGRDVPN